MIKPDRNESLQNPNFYAEIMEAFYSSDEYAEALEDFIDKHWDSLSDEYWSDSNND